MRRLKRRSEFIVFVLFLAVCLLRPCILSQAATTSKGINNIVARAYQQVNMKWTCRKTMNAYRDSSGKLTGTFKKGVVYTGVPYGQPVEKGKYLPFDATFSTFLDATTNENSLFYTSRGKYSKRDSPYYSSDCSAFVCYCYGISRMPTSSIASSKLFTKVSGNSIYNAQVGDCYNKSGSHVVLITKMNYDTKGNLVTVEVSEQTPPLAKSTLYTAAEVQSKIKSKGYTLLRYVNRDSVPAPLLVNAPFVNMTKIDRITLSCLSKEIARGKKMQLTAGFVPVNATNRTLIWNSSDPKVATVSKTGLVTANKSAGGKSAVITATATDGSGVKVSIIVKVKQGIVKKVKISGKKTVLAGQTLTLKGKVTASSGANKKLLWSSSKTKYATVSQTGIVTAASSAKGKSVYITAQATDGSGKKRKIKVKIR